MRYLGVDYGTKKVGLALSDETGSMGFPHAVILVTPRLVDDMARIIAQEDVGAVVIGESRNLAGTDNAVMPAARAFAAELAERTGVPISYESEVYTSALARRVPEREGKSRSVKVPSRLVDASAAALILTSYLSRLHHG